MIVARLGDAEMRHIQRTHRWTVAMVALAVLAGCGTRVPGEIAGLHAARVSSVGGTGGIAPGGSSNISGTSRGGGPVSSGNSASSIAGGSSISGARGGSGSGGAAGAAGRVRAAL